MGENAATKTKGRTVDKLFMLQAALLRPDLTKADALVLAALIEYTNGIYGYAWPSVKSVASVTGLTRRAVQLSLRRLEQAGMVETDTGGGRARSSRYVIQLGAFAQSPLSDLIKRAAEERAHARSPIDGPEKAHARSPISEQERANSHAERANNRSRKGEQLFARTLLTNPSYKNPSVNTAPPVVGAPSKRSLSKGNQNGKQLVAIELRKCETWLKELSGWLPEGPVDSEEADKLLEALQAWQDWCFDQFNEHGLDEPLGGWSGRLMDDAHHLIQQLDDLRP